MVGLMSSPKKNNPIYPAGEKPAGTKQMGILMKVTSFHFNLLHPSLKFIV
jgi:hypothetical protein